MILVFPDPDPPQHRHYPGSRHDHFRETGRGLYWLVPTILVYLVWSVVDVWTLVVEAASEGRRQ
jgi:hypothetical protein